MYHGDFSLRNVVDLADQLNDPRHLFLALRVVAVAPPPKIKPGSMAVSLELVVKTLCNTWN